LQPDAAAKETNSNHIIFCAGKGNEKPFRLIGFKWKITPHYFLYFPRLKPLRDIDLVD